MNRILCGLPMSGKSTIGKKLASKLGLEFIDTDRMLESAYASVTGNTCTCRQIYLDRGEDYFRALEEQQIQQLQRVDDSVIALGGGALNCADTIKILRSVGTIFYLKTPPEILWKRILEKGIPAYLDLLDPEGSFYLLAEKRSKNYVKAAHVLIETGNLAEGDVLEAIINLSGVNHG